MQVWNLLHAALWKHRTQKSRQKSPSVHHPFQICRAISSQLRHISTIGKKLVKQRYVLHMSPQYGELRPTSGWDRLTSLGYPCKCQLVSRLGSITAWHLVVGVSQTSRRWIEGTTYIRQGDHHVGHWPTFLVNIVLVSTWWNFSQKWWYCGNCTRWWTSYRGRQIRNHVVNQIVPLPVILNDLDGHFSCLKTFMFPNPQKI